MDVLPHITTQATRVRDIERRFTPGALEKSCKHACKIQQAYAPVATKKLTTVAVVEWFLEAIFAKLRKQDECFETTPERFLTPHRPKFEV